MCCHIQLQIMQVTDSHKENTLDQKQGKQGTYLELLQLLIWCKDLDQAFVAQDPWHYQRLLAKDPSQNQSPT